MKFSLLVAILLMPADVDTDAEAALALARAIAANSVPVKQAPTYTESLTQAQSEQKPIVVFVGCDTREVSGAVCVSTDLLPGAECHEIVVGVPYQGGMAWAATLPAEASDAQIRAAIAKGVVKGMVKQSNYQAPTMYYGNRSTACAGGR